MLARAEGLADARLPSKSPVVKQCEAMAMVVGEYGGESFMVTRLTAKSAEAAEQISKVLEGLGAMAALHSEDFPEVMDVIQSVDVDVDDRMVALALRAPADAVWEHGQRLYQQMREKRHELRKHWLQHRARHD
jgi:hypothetical protein